jgi:hypothetical protein
LPSLLRLLGLVGAALVVLVLPVGDATVLLALTLAVDLAVALLAVRQVPARRQSVVLPIGKQGGSIYLRRRTEPALRMHRPSGVVEAQIRWRQTSEARRRVRPLALALRLD